MSKHSPAHFLLYLFQQIIPIFLKRDEEKEEPMSKPKHHETRAHLEKALSKEEVEVAAYYHWQNRGCPVNDELCDWVAAEQNQS